MSLFHGENRGSIPLGRAKNFKGLFKIVRSRVQFVSGRHFGLQRTNANDGEVVALPLSRFGIARFGRGIPIWVVGVATAIVWVRRARASKAAPSPANSMLTATIYWL